MAIQDEVVLRQRVCLRDPCRSVFYVCSRCDRGQRYCSRACRRQARLHQHRCANRRYRNSPEARADHRDRQRRYRQQRAQPRVPDQGSISISFRASSECGNGEPTITDTPSRPGTDRVARKPPSVGLRCSFCRRAGRLVNPFPLIPKRR